MATGKILLVAAIAAMSLPASAAVQVVGSSDARMCYEAADSPLTPSSRDFQHCDDALGVGASLTAYEEVATHVNRGILRLRRGQIDDAVGDFDAAIALDP